MNTEVRRKILMMTPLIYTVKSRGFFNLINNAFVRHGWVFFAYLFLAGSWLKLFPYTTLLIHLIGVGILYEIGYLLNDGIAEKNEKNPTQKTWQPNAARREVIEAALIRVLLLLVFHHLFFSFFGSLYGIAIAFLSITYLFHNSLETRFRPVTFFMLRMFRAIATYAFCFEFFEKEIAILVVALLLGDALYYTIFYVTYKLYGDASQFDEKTDFFRLFFMLGSLDIFIITTGAFGGTANRLIFGVIAYFWITWLIRVGKNKFICPPLFTIIVPQKSGTMKPCGIKSNNPSRRPENS